MHHPLNLRVLQRHDPSITDIVGSTSHAVLYSFSEDRWHKTGKEGTLFIYERSESPTHGIFLLNRSSPENYSHPILASTALDLQAKVLMLEDPADDDANVVSGLWVSNAEEGQTLLDRLTEIRDSLQSRAAPPLASQAAAAAVAPVDALASLLSNLATSSSRTATSAAAASPSLPLSTAAPALLSQPVSSTLAPAPATTTTTTTISPVAPPPASTATTTTTTTNGSLSFTEILNRLQSPALPKASPAPTPDAAQPLLPQPPPGSSTSAPPEPYSHLPPFPSSPARPSQLPPSAYVHGSPGPSFHPSPLVAGSNPAASGGPGQHYPYPPHQLHHYHHSHPPTHAFAHQGSAAAAVAGVGGGSPAGSPFAQHAGPVPFGFSPQQHAPPSSHQQQLPHPSSPFAQRLPAVNGPSLSSSSNLPTGLAGPPSTFPHPTQQQQQQQQPHQPPSFPRPPPHPPASPSRHPSTSTPPAPQLPRGTQLLDAMFSSLGPPVLSSRNGH